MKLHLRIRFTVLLLFLTAPLHAQDHPLSKSLLITEVMWSSGHPKSDPETGYGGNANDDWWELTNVTDEPIDMTGFLWDDDDALRDFDYTTFPELVIQPREAIIILRENGDTVDSPDGFRAAWGLPAELRLFTTEFFEGSLDTFSGLSSGGDELNLYDADEEQIQFIPLDVAEPGLSRAWGFEDGEFVDFGLSEVGEFGAYLALSDGSENRLVRDDDGNILLEDDGSALIDESFVPEFLDIAAPGVVYGFDVALPSIGPNPIDLDTLCSDVSAGNATSDDLADALQQLGILAGDADQDGRVGFLDFLQLANHFGQSDASFSGRRFRL